MGSLVRKGRVSSINYETGMVRVEYRDKGAAVTAELPMLNLNDEYRMPEIGQDVACVHLSNGTSRGVVLGTYWNQKYKPAETGKKLYRKDLSRIKDAAYVRYDDETGEYLVKTPKVHVNGVDETLLDGPHMALEANIRIRFETPEIVVATDQINLAAGEAEQVQIEATAGIDFAMQKNELKAMILSAVVETIEKLEIQAGTEVVVNAKENLHAAAGEELVIEDCRYRVTLTDILQRLEAIDGRQDGRK